MNFKDLTVRYILNVLETLNLTQDNINIAKDYLTGAVSEEGLKKLTYKDLFGKHSSEVYSAMRTFLEKKDYDEACALFNILFSIGQSSCYWQLPVKEMKDHYAQLFTEETAYQYLAVYARELIRDDNKINSSVVQNLETFEIDFEGLKNAVKCQKGYGEDEGKALLLAIYFKRKYTNKMLEAADGMVPQIEKDDLGLFNKYEEAVINCAKDNLFAAWSREKLAKDINDAMRGDDIDRIRHLVEAETKNLIVWIGQRKAACIAAYINFPLSNVFRNVLQLGFFVGIPSMLTAIYEISKGLNIDIQRIGENFDKLFNFDDREYIAWAARSDCRELLAKKLYTDRAVYLEILTDGIENDKGKKADTTLLEVIREKEPDLFQEIMAERTKGGGSQAAQELADGLTSRLKETDKTHIRDYILGRENLDIAFAYLSQFMGRGYINWDEENLLENYIKLYGESGLTYRCRVYFFAMHVWAGEEKISEFFDYFDKEGVSIEQQLSIFDILHNNYCSKESMEQYAGYLRPVFVKRLKEKREETLAAFSGLSIFGRQFALTVMEVNADENKQEILAYAQDSSKAVRDTLADVLYMQKDWEDDIRKLLSDKKKSVREVGERVLQHWEGGDDNTDLIAQLHRGGKKRSLSWAYETPFSPVHKKDGSVADDEYLQAILLTYSTSTAEAKGANKDAMLLAKTLDTDELAVYITELFEKWVNRGAVKNKRWVLYASSIHGGEEIVKRMYRQIQEWCKLLKFSVASEAVDALSLNPTQKALVTIDNISRNFKYKKVREAAKAAMESIASRLGVTREELDDRIVPDLGFDENMERIFDYGGRKFTVTITTALEVEVFDGSGKKLKNLPKAAKNDDNEKAATAYEEFKQMKKQIKTVADTQKVRLETALFEKREWDADAWKALFVKNPIMHQFAISLIWGIYEDGRLIQSFRYMEDGSFNTEDEEEYELPANDKTDSAQIGQAQIGTVGIGLVHPVELTDVSLSKWKQQLEDYEIKQPILQLERPFHRLEENEMEESALKRFNGCVINEISLGSRLLKMGWQHGRAESGGAFYTYCREDRSVGFGAELHFSGSVEGYPNNEDVTVYDANFFKVSENGKDRTITLQDVPSRYFSEIIMQIEKTMQL